MKISVKELTTAGPSIHSSFEKLPYQRAELASRTLAKPVLAYQSPSCIKIIGDIHRFKAAQEKGQATIPAYLIQETESTMDLVKLALEYYQPLTLMDKALFTQVAIDLGIPRVSIAKEMFPEMELAPREKLIDQVLFLLKLPASLKSFIVEKDLSLKRALIFQRAEDHLEWVSQLIANLKIGINMTAEIIQNIWEMGQNENIDFKSKAVDMGLWDMATDNYDDPRLAVMEIRDKINKARFPTLSKAGQDLSETIADLQLPHTVKVKWDPYFERQGVDVGFHAKDDSELEAILEKLATSAFKNIFKHI